MRWLAGPGAALVLVTGLVFAAAAELDTAIMESLEVVSESLASNIALADVAAARTDAADLQSLFAEVQAHFAARGDAVDAVEYAKKSRELAGAVRVALEAGKFDDAANAASEIGRTCKACHRKYKP